VVFIDCKIASYIARLRKHRLKPLAQFELDAAPPSAEPPPITPDMPYFATLLEHLAVGVLLDFNGSLESL
jgi:hypothetical protein